MPAVAPPDPARTAITAPAPAEAVSAAAPVTDGTAPGETPDEPGAPAGDPAGPDGPVIYTPTSDEDAAMYQAWLDALSAGREPTGADLARAAGRDNDTSGTGRRAATATRTPPARPRLPPRRRSPTAT